MQRPRLERHRLQDERRRRRHVVAAARRVLQLDRERPRHHRQPVAGRHQRRSCSSLLPQQQAGDDAALGGRDPVGRRADGRHGAGARCQLERPCRLDRHRPAAGPRAPVVRRRAERIVIQANYRGSGTAADVGFAILSDDGGTTWRPSAGIVPACNEGQVAPAQNGSLLMNCRTDGYHRLLSWSDDRGDSWSPPISWYFGPPGSGSPCEGSVVRASAELLAFSNNYGAGQGVENGCDRCNLTVWSSADSGATWAGIAQVDDDPTVAGARQHCSRSTRRTSSSCTSAAARRRSRCGRSRCVAVAHKSVGAHRRPNPNSRPRQPLFGGGSRRRGWSTDSHAALPRHTCESATSGRWLTAEGDDRGPQACWHVR